MNRRNKDPLKHYERIVHHLDGASDVVEIVALREAGTTVIEKRNASKNRSHSLLLISLLVIVATVTSTIIALAR